MSDPTAYDFPEIYERIGMRLGHFGCIMLDVQPVPVTTLCPDTDYYFSDDPMLRYVQGPVGEKAAHATLLYGLTPDDEAGIRQRESVDALLDGLDLSSVTVDHVDYFPAQFGKPYACIVGKLSTGGALGEANRRLRFLPHIDTFVDYKPHVTLAYVHEDSRRATIATLNEALHGVTLPARGINYGGKF